MSIIQVLRIICEFKVILKVKYEDLNSWHKMENWTKHFAIYAIKIYTILIKWYNFASVIYVLLQYII